MKYVIGVDCGGTKTIAAAYDLLGHLLLQTDNGFGNLLVDYDQGLNNIQQTIQEIQRKLGMKNCTFLALGIAGVDSGGLKEKLLKEFKTVGYPVAIYNDAQFAYLSQFRVEEAGILVIAGTGSAVFGRKQQKWYRVGGWGHLLGDEGGAYWIGLQAIKNVLAGYDQDNAERSSLATAVMEAMRVRDVFELTKKAYQLNKAQIAELAQVVAEQAVTESAAQAILTEAGEQLALQATLLAKKMSINHLKIVVSGSVLEKNQLVYQQFLTSLKEKQLQYQIIPKNAAITKAAYYIYLEEKES